MMTKVKYVHTKIVDKDRRRLAQFHVNTFGCRVIQGAGAIDDVYVRDPEGNIIELQKWEAS